MRVQTTISLICLLLVSGALKASAPQPPQILGVWYGTYKTAAAAGDDNAEMWMEISWQLSKNGWDVRGHNRWNVRETAREIPQGAASLGKAAEHFDRVSGRIARDGKSVTFREDTRKSRMKARLTGPNTLSATFYEAGAASPSFSLELRRIDTAYSAADATVLGLDVSHHSGKVDWDTVKSNNFRFAYVKATEGVDNPDAMFEEHWKGLKDAGLARGAFHFYVTEDDPVEQAHFFASRLKDDPGTLPPAVDVELLGANTTGDLNADLHTFLKTLQNELGVKPLIYTTSEFWDRHYEPEFSDYPLWMAEYGVKMPKAPFGWDTWLIWQHAANRRVEGVEKNADINLLHPHASLKALGANSGSD